MYAMVSNSNKGETFNVTADISRPNHTAAHVRVNVHCGATYLAMSPGEASALAAELCAAVTAAEKLEAQLAEEAENHRTRMADKMVGEMDDVIAYRAAKGD
jgi:hypothetical protein